MADTVLDMLLSAGDSFVSGEEMSRRLGITRAAVWKQIGGLRKKGYDIEAVTNHGYRILSAPELLDREKILAELGDHPWANRLTVLATVDSTNSLAKREALNGSPHGSVYVSDEQTGGRGRQGRAFVSPRGKGIYLTVLLRPECGPAELSHATAMAGVATCDAIENVCGIRPGIKWTNDLLLEERKIVGILSELSVEWESGRLEYLVIGIGINCTQREEDFPEELRDKAGSISMFTGKRVDRNRLTAELIRRLCVLSEEMLIGKARWLRQYASDCITIGRQVQVIRGERVRTGTATGVDENGGLIVRYDSGETGVVFSGEVSVRGMSGYI